MKHEPQRRGRGRWKPVSGGGELALAALHPTIPCATILRATTLCAAALFAAAGPAAAAEPGSPYEHLVVTATITNSYAYSIAGGPVRTVVAGEQSSLRVGASSGGFVSELGLDLTGRANGDDFFFLHNAYCVGTCSVSLDTHIMFTLTNQGTVPLDVRFDSLITPGHLAQISSGSSGNGHFDFIVQEQSSSVPGTITRRHIQGSSNGGYGGSITAAFNGFFRDDQSLDPDHPQSFTVMDWSATPLNLSLATIAPNGGVGILEYISGIDLVDDALCTDLATCGGIQVAFGDPRNSGTVKSFAAFLALTPPADPEPLIGRQFDAYVTPSAFVDPSLVTELPAAPPSLPRVTYVNTFTSQVSGVPEPASWAMLICGFACIGGALRRRPALAVARV